MNKKNFEKYKDSTMMTCFYVSLAANWYWVLAAVLAFVANRIWGLSILVPLALLLVWVVSAMISASMIKHASENPMPTEERANVNPYSKSSQDYVKVEKPEKVAEEEKPVAEEKPVGAVVTEEVAAVVNEEVVPEAVVNTETLTTPEDFGLSIEGQTELDKALKFDVEEKVEKIPELIPNGDIEE